uniref:Uncharacterized protein n=1 Tax=Meloidogyne javanica TaxID=6303 RepID=A0A915M3N4_MELJA
CSFSGVGEGSPGEGGPGDDGLGDGGLGDGGVSAASSFKSNRLSSLN